MRVQPNIEFGSVEIEHWEAVDGETMDVPRTENSTIAYDRKRVQFHPIRF